MKKITVKQKRLLEEIEYIRKIAYDHTKSVNTSELERERYELIRNRILSDCVMLEEAMSIVIMDHILRDSEKWRSIKYFGRIKRFIILSQDIIGHIPSFQKLKVLNKFIKIPKRLQSIMRKLFDLRNTFAHFYAIDFTKIKKIFYDNSSLLEIKTFEKYCRDFNEAMFFILKRIKGL